MISRLSFLLAVAGGLSANAAPSQPVPSQQEPCLDVYNRYQQAVNANTTDELQIPGELAYNCLQSMPFDAKNGTQFVQEYKKFVQWHSTLDILKNPPVGYLSPSTDILGGLEIIQSKAEKNEYSSQYDFDSAIYSLLNTANDGHLAALVCSNQVFGFYVELPLVSISKDGVAMPEIYTKDDADVLNSDSEDKVSPVVAINGEPVVAALESLSSTNSYQDPDARYNQIFSWPAREIVDTLMPQGYFAYRSLWPGRAEHEILFANGTVHKQPTVAEISSKIDYAYKDGRSLLDGVCLQHPTPSQASETPSATPSATPSVTPSPAPSMYPEPEMRDEYNLISGYYLNEDDLKDVAVLLVPTFETMEPEDEPMKFANHATKFIEKAVKDGKKKLVIDLAFNGGGRVNSGYDLFELFFPEQDIYAASRFRAHEAANVAGQVLAPLDMKNLTELTDCAKAGGYCLEARVSANQTYEFGSWPEVYGPHEQFGGQMSSLIAPQSMDFFSSQFSPIRGYGTVPQDPKKAPFKAEDILLVTDGSCTSTCTIFAELMKNQAGVKSITFGGRPRAGPMQAIGGSKGNEAGQIATIAAIAEAALKYADEQQADQLSQLFPNLDNVPFALSKASVNYLSAFRKGEDEVPLQFIYEAADFRRFYTYENIVKPETVWVDAARAYWGKGGVVPGSTSISQGAELPFDLIIPSLIRQLFVIGKA